MMVLRMSFEMLGQVRYPLAEDRYLDLRGPGVLFMHLKIADYGLFLYFIECHAITTFSLSLLFLGLKLST